MRGVTLEEVSAATRISTRFLEALENEQWDRLPGGAFNRGFVRAVAKFLGLDEDSLVAEYAIETKSLTPLNAAPQATVQGMPRDYRSAIAAAVALVVLILGMIFGIHFYRARARRELEQSMAMPVLPKLPAPAPPEDLLVPAAVALTPAADLAPASAKHRRHSH